MRTCTDQRRRADLGCAGHSSRSAPLDSSVQARRSSLCRSPPNDLHTPSMRCGAVSDCGHPPVLPCLSFSTCERNSQEIRPHVTCNFEPTKLAAPMLAGMQARPGARHSSSATACTSLSAQVLHTHRASVLCHQLLPHKSCDLFKTLAHTPHIASSGHTSPSTNKAGPMPSRTSSPCCWAWSFQPDNPSGNHTLHSAGRHLVKRCCMDCKQMLCAQRCGTSAQCRMRGHRLPNLARCTPLPSPTHFPRVDCSHPCLPLVEAGTSPNNPQNQHTSPRSHKHPTQRPQPCDVRTAPPCCLNPSWPDRW